jgi:hypothetical protein
MAEVVTARAESGLDRAWNDICTLGLQTQIADLDARGYTVIPPEIASPNGLRERMLEAVLNIAERRNGERPDLETGATHANLPITTTAKPRERGRLKGRMPTLTEDRDSPVGDVMKSMLLEDPVFEESLMNPALLAMASYLCGYNVVVSSMNCWMKGPNDSTFRLHTDTPLPSPLPNQALVCQCLYLLTDYNRLNGGTAFVPGSHKWCRQPTGQETLVGEGGNDQAVPIEAAAGSLLVWHGNTWHGAFNRVAPGLRVSVHNYMVRPFIRTREDLIGRMPQEVLDRNPSRFAILTQQGIPAGRVNQDDEQAKAAHAQKYNAAYEKELGPGLRAKDSLYN